MIRSIIKVNPSSSGGSGATFIEAIPDLPEFEGSVVFWLRQEFVDLPRDPSAINKETDYVALFLKPVSEGAQTTYRIEQIGHVNSWSRPFQLPSGRQGFTISCASVYRPGQGPVGSHSTDHIRTDNVAYVDWSSFNTGTKLLRPAFDVVLPSPTYPEVTSAMPSKWATDIDLTNANEYRVADLLWQYVSKEGDPHTLKTVVIVRSSKCHLDGPMPGAIGSVDLLVQVDYLVPPSTLTKWGQFYSTIGTPLAISPSDGDLYWFALKIVDGQVWGGLVRMKDSATFLGSVDDVYYLLLGMERVGGITETPVG